MRFRVTSCCLTSSAGEVRIEDAIGGGTNDVGDENEMMTVLHVRNAYQTWRRKREIQDEIRSNNIIKWTIPCWIHCCKVFLLFGKKESNIRGAQKMLHSISVDVFRLTGMVLLAHQENGRCLVQFYPVHSRPDCCNCHRDTRSRCWHATMRSVSVDPPEPDRPWLGAWYHDRSEIIKQIVRLLFLLWATWRARRSKFFIPKPSTPRT
jgi:hypothetical protein